MLNVSTVNVMITEKNGYINKMKEIVFVIAKFAQINIEEGKQLNFLLKFID